MSTSHTTHGAGSPISAEKLLDMYYLDLRSALLEAAAGLDRVQKAGDAETMSDPRVKALVEAACIIGDGLPDRATRILESLSVE